MCTNKEVQKQQNNENFKVQYSTKTRTLHLPLYESDTLSFTLIVSLNNHRLLKIDSLFKVRSYYILITKTSILIYSLWSYTPKKVKSVKVDVFGPNFGPDTSILVDSTFSRI